MDGANDPAVGTAAPNAVGSGETPISATQGQAGQSSGPESTGASASPAAQPSDASASSKPDYQTLLQDKEFRKYLFDHPEIKAELEHRASSEAGRRAKAQMEAWQRDVAERQALAQLEAEREQLLKADPYDAGLKMQQRMKEQAAQQAAIAEGLKFAGSVLHRRIQGRPDLTPDEKAYLDLRNPQFQSMEEWQDAVDDVLGRKKAEGLRKQIEAEVRKKFDDEVNARVQEKLAPERDRSDGPAVLPPGGNLSDKDIIAGYASGTSDNHGYMTKKMKNWGLL